MSIYRSYSMENDMQALFGYKFSSDVLQHLPKVENEHSLYSSRIAIPNFLNLVKQMQQLPCIIAYLLVSYVVNKLKHKGIYSNEATIASEILNMIEEMEPIPNMLDTFQIAAHALLLNKWNPPDYRVLKITTDVAFPEGKIGIRLLVQNHPGNPHMVQVLLHNRNYYVHYGELEDIL